MLKRQLVLAGAAAALVLCAALSAQATPQRGGRQPELMNVLPEPAPSSDLAIWVGEIELRGKKLLWVELIDQYGEVVYDSEIAPNETHLLPDGSAIIVRRAAGRVVIAKAFSDRVFSELRTITTRRVITNADGVTEIEYRQPAAKPVAEPDSDLMIISRSLQQAWSKIAGLFTATVDKVRHAWATVAGLFTA